MILSTLGYQGVDIERFVNFLARNEIEMLIDVRENPISRKKGFSKNVLKENVQNKGIGYIHFPGLGSKKELRAEYKQSNDWELFSSNYIKYLESKKDDIQELEKIVLENVCCLMCFEADHNYCHRGLISNEIKNDLKNAVEIRHLSFN